MRPRILFNGYKTYLGGALIALSAVMPYLDTSVDASAMRQLGESLGLIGLGHKLAKAKY